MSLSVLSTLVYRFLSTGAFLINLISIDFILFYEI